MAIDLKETHINVTNQKNKIYVYFISLRTSKLKKSENNKLKHNFEKLKLHILHINNYYRKNKFSK